MGPRSVGRGHRRPGKLLEGLADELTAFAEAVARGGKGNEPLPPIPSEVEHVWRWFRDLNSARSYGMAANPISFSEIEAYSRLIGEAMPPWEVSLLRRVDAAFLRVADKDEGPKAEADGEARKNGSAIAAMMRTWV